ncbi:DMT family transporter [Defluviimonas sp. WL0002]|uniref:DMT family transporter n=1 Tax=Albidovulum marisflavi TaxID=2984159 RepID=A0ABT2ZIK6_9RHOB|nr:DMT family transporter [Defluviimonas sp. WL0002]MCV2870556.1 DMT family transporter [Defluviimonas sp. WL0002]
MSEAPAPRIGWTDIPMVGIVAVGISTIFFGCVPFFARSLTEAGIAPPAIAFFRYMFPAIAFLPFLKLKGEQGKASLWGYFSGLAVGLGWVGYVKALTLMPVSAAGVLYMTYPLFTLVVGWLLFSDRPSLRAAAGGALILLAAGLAARSTGSAAPVALLAIVFALAAPLAFGISINVLARKLHVLPPVSRIGIFAIGSASGLVPLILTYPTEAVLPSTSDQWMLALSLGLFSALIPQILYTVFVPKIGGAKAAALGSIELPTMFAVGWLAFGEAVGLREVLAGALVLTAILITPSRRPLPSLTATMAAPRRRRWFGPRF